MLFPMAGDRATMSKHLYAAAVCTLVLLGAALAGCVAAEQSAGPAEDRDILYQASTIDALLLGAYDGCISIGELRAHGDFGIGCLHKLDGELVAVDGGFYQIRHDGTVHPVADVETAPFAAVTFFDSDETIMLDGPMNLTVLQERVLEHLPSENYFYAIRIDGTFPSVEARSVPAQERPYPRLVDVVADQSVFSFQNETGSLVGFWTPAFAEGINVPGYHFHFITDDRTGGGHVLDLYLEEAEVQIDMTPDFSMSLPTGGDFPGLDLSGGLQEDLATVER